MQQLHIEERVSLEAAGVSANEQHLESLSSKDGETGMSIYLQSLLGINNIATYSDLKFDSKITAWYVGNIGR